MKIARKIPLLCCILSMAYVAGCTLEEPNDLALRCYDEQHKLSQFFYEIENNKTSQTIICSNDASNNKSCDRLKLI